MLKSWSGFNLTISYSLGTKNTANWTSQWFFSYNSYLVNALALFFHSCTFYVCSVFYEEEESNFDCKLWRYRSVIGYDHLLQVFSSQPLCESNKHPFLRKFLEEQPLLACTRYLPDFVSLYLKLVQKSSLIYNNKKLWDMCISDFLHVINKGTYFAV